MLFWEKEKEKYKKRKPSQRMQRSPWRRCMPACMCASVYTYQAGKDRVPCSGLSGLGGWGVLVISVVVLGF